MQANLKQQSRSACRSRGAGVLLMTNGNTFYGRTLSQTLAGKQEHNTTKKNSCHTNIQRAKNTTNKQNNVETQHYATT